MDRRDGGLPLVLNIRTDEVPCRRCQGSLLLVEILSGCLSQEGDILRQPCLCADTRLVCGVKEWMILKPDRE